MATRGMRHAVLWITDPAASASLYEQALGLATKAVMGDALDLDADIAPWGADRPGRCG